MSDKVSVKLTSLEIDYTKLDSIQRFKLSQTAGILIAPILQGILKGIEITSLETPVRKY